MNKIYLIKALTNMHVGDGQANYNIIDNEVQRDALTEFPVIHASSLKGAMLHYAKSKNVASDLTKYVFGKSESAGRYRFFDGRLLSIPVRSKHKPFYMATCPMIIKDLLDLADFLQVELPAAKDLQKLANFDFQINNPGKTQIIYCSQDEGNSKIEGMPAIFHDFKFDALSKLENILGPDLVLFSNKIFKEYVKELPVIARNRLENGISDNLWYEEIIPRQSCFYFGLYQEERYQTEFGQLLTKDYVQIGANASIGYGYTKIMDICGKAGDFDA